MLILRWIGPMRLSHQEVLRIPLGIRGVYLLHSFAAAFGGYPVFYAGKSSHLRRRLLEHLEGAAKPGIWSLQRSTAAYFSAAAISHPILLDRAESGLIRALRPACNNQVPTAAPLLVNLPPLKASLL